MKQKLALLALAIPFLAAVAAAAVPDAPAPAPAASATQTVALLAAIGDRIEVVRQLRTSARPSDPYRRTNMQISGQALNFAVLRGLDKALTEEEPQAQHVLLQWEMPADVAEQLKKARGGKRQELVVNSLTEHLKRLPERQQWDRIEVIVPAYTYLDKDGVGARLSGIGVFVQPQARQVFDLTGMTDPTSGNSVVSSTETDGDYRTVDPKTGATAHSATYVASFMYFERLTYDAKTMALIKRQSFFDNTKYADPNATAQDVGDQMTNDELMGKVLERVERSAYKSIRPVTSEVTVSEPKVVAAPASAPQDGRR